MFFFVLLDKVYEMFLPIDESRHLSEGTISCASPTCTGRKRGGESVEDVSHLIAKVRQLLRTQRWR